MGHIEYRSGKGKESSWRITVSLGNDKDGKYARHRETVKGTKGDAKRRMREIESEVDKATYVPPSKVSVGEYLQRWIEAYAVLHTSKRTAESYQDELHRHVIPALGSIELTSLRPHHIEEYYVKALTSGRMDGNGGLSPRTVLYHHRILSEALEHAVRQGALSKNPAKLVRPPRPEQAERSVLRRPEIRRFLEAAVTSEYYELFVVAIHTGARIGELLALQWKYVDLSACIINVEYTLERSKDGWQLKPPKSRRGRRPISLQPLVVTTLRNHRINQERIRKELGLTLTDTDFVFGQVRGNPRDRHAVGRGLARVLKNAGLQHVSFHELRHTHATHLLQSGTNVLLVTKRLGHATPGFTLQNYGHVMPGAEEDAVLRYAKYLTEETE